MMDLGRAEPRDFRCAWQRKEERFTQSRAGKLPCGGHTGSEPVTKKIFHALTWHVSHGCTFKKTLSFHSSGGERSSFCGPLPCLPLACSLGSVSLTGPATSTSVGPLPSLQVLPSAYPCPAAHPCTPPSWPLTALCPCILFFIPDRFSPSVLLFFSSLPDHRLHGESREMESVGHGLFTFPFPAVHNPAQSRVDLGVRTGCYILDINSSKWNHQSPSFTWPLLAPVSLDKGALRGLQPNSAWASRSLPREPGLPRPGVRALHK
ncbi:uncharacterized protein LOC101705188 [Heterocephalus glaber]|uniref:Uncharacterized protein LOC101705188 n=1 Tax=Heterocephalus glaber TaxID=10181 RepID=A0AAX6T2R5_HETGA|nr:uncharacterized protein LOC101705188 [Heterocephalus glaber]